MSLDGYNDSELRTTPQHILAQRLRRTNYSHVFRYTLNTPLLGILTGCLVLKAGKVRSYLLECWFKAYIGYQKAYRRL